MLFKNDKRHRKKDSEEITKVGICANIHDGKREHTVDTTRHTDGRETHHSECRHHARGISHGSLCRQNPCKSYTKHARSARHQSSFCNRRRCIILVLFFAIWFAETVSGGKSRSHAFLTCERFPILLTRVVEMYWSRRAHIMVSEKNSNI